MTPRHLITLFSAACFSMLLMAQPKTGSIPDDIFYLMPEFGDGVVFFQGQPPAQGKLNICAVDNTLRFIDDSGQELEAESTDNIVMVQIGQVYFLHNSDGFFRKYPVTANMGVAYQRSIRILRGAKRGAYGVVDQTSSIRQYSSIQAEGGTYKLSTEEPYEEDESISLYIGNTVIPMTRRSLRKMFPSRADEINAWFKSGHSMPKTVEEAQNMLSQWAN